MTSLLIGSQTVLKLETLRASATHEFELRGPFPTKAYSRIIDSTNKMLDALHTMNVVIQHTRDASVGEISLLRYTAEERAQLCARISHLLQVLASSMRLEYPLSNALPSTDNARDRLLAKIWHYRRDVAGLENDATSSDHVSTAPTDGDYAILYAFTLVTARLGQEIKKVEREVEELFGVMDEGMLDLL